MKRKMREREKASKNSTTYSSVTWGHVFNGLSRPELRTIKASQTNPLGSRLKMQVLRRDRESTKQKKRLERHSWKKKMAKSLVLLRLDYNTYLQLLSRKRALLLRPKFCELHRWRQCRSSALCAPLPAKIRIKRNKKKLNRRFADLRSNRQQKEHEFHGSKETE